MILACVLKGTTPSVLLGERATMRKTILATLFPLLLSLNSANATVLTWELVNVVFDDQTAVTGSFDFDSDTNTYSNWSLSVEAGGIFPAFTYLQSNGSAGIACGAAPTCADFVSIASALNGSFLRLEYDSPLTNSGGTIDLTLAFPNRSFECDNCNNFRYITGGAVRAFVPAPATLALLGLGLLGVGYRRRQHKVG
jgi:hypothetical protein